MRKRTRYRVASAVEPCQEVRAIDFRQDTCVAEACACSMPAIESDTEEDGVAHAGIQMFIPIVAKLANSTTINYMNRIRNATGVDFNTTAFYVIRHWNTTGPPRWARILPINGVLTEELLEEDDFDSDGVLYPVKKEGFMPMILVLPLGGMLLFLSLIALVVMFRRHPAIVMAVTASSLLAAGAYNLGLVLWTSEESAYRTTFDPRAPPKYE